MNTRKTESSGPEAAGGELRIPRLQPWGVSTPCPCETQMLRPCFEGGNEHACICFALRNAELPG